MCKQKKSQNYWHPALITCMQVFDILWRLSKDKPLFFVTGDVFLLFLLSGMWQRCWAWLQSCWGSAPPPPLTARGCWPWPHWAWRCWAGPGWGAPPCGDEAGCREPPTAGPRSSSLWSTTAKLWPDCLAKPCVWCRRPRSSPEDSPCKCAAITPFTLLISSFRKFSYYS